MLWYILTIAASNSSDIDKSKADYVCDGIDDQEDINQAITDLPDKGGDILLTAGTYKIRIIDPQINAIQLKNDITLKGQGPEATFIKVIESQVQFSNTIFLDNLKNVKLMDFNLDGNWPSGNTPSTKGIGIREGSNNLIENIHLKDFSEHFIAMAGAKNVLIDNIKTSNTPGLNWPSHGIDIDERGGSSVIGSANITIQNSILDNSGHDSTKVEHAKNITYINNIFYDRVILANDARNDTVGLEDIFYINNTFSDQVRIGIRTGTVSFYDNTFDENGFINILTFAGNVNLFNNAFNGTSDYFGFSYEINAQNNTGVNDHDVRYVSVSPTGPRWNSNPDPDINVDTKYLTPETAAADIQSAIYSAEDGDIILIADGIYKGNGNINLSTLGKAVTIKSINGAKNVTVDAEGAPNTNMFNINSAETTSTVIDGLTLTGGNRNYDAGAIKISGSSPLLTNLILENNTANLGGAIRITNNSSPIISNSKFTNNTALSDATNAGIGGAISIDNSSQTTISYSIFNNNKADEGGAIAIKGNATTTVTNVTIVNNTSPLGGALSVKNSSVSLYNSILWDNSTEINSLGTYDIEVNYSNIMGGYPGPGNLNNDPLFTAPLENDFSLQPSSPLIDAGIDLNYEIDHIGNNIYDTPNISNSGSTGIYSRDYIDIGAIEFVNCAENSNQKNNYAACSNSNNESIVPPGTLENSSEATTTDSGALGLLSIVFLTLCRVLTRHPGSIHRVSYINHIMGN